MNWGESGGGAADVALFIISVVIDEPKTMLLRQGACGRRAWQLHHAFMQQFVAKWGEAWAITVGEVRQWIQRQSVS